MQPVWMEPEPCDVGRLMSVRREIRLPSALAEVLVRRGVEAPQFLDPRLKDLSPPEEIPGVIEAVARIHNAILRKRRIVLYGDYDVDGVASLAFCSRLLKTLGADVSCFLPSRSEEGYGLSAGGVARCRADHDPEVLIAIDCGTNSVKEIADLADGGVEVLVLDHHEPSGKRPQAVVVNPKLSDSALRYLCSAGVVFKVVHALLKTVPESGIDLREYLDFVALATVADIVPLVDENRILVHRGLQQLARSRWCGIRALMLTASVSGRVSGSDIGFRLGPRINASGRMGMALDSLALLTTDDPTEAARLAARLEERNRERQSIERTVSVAADAWLEGRFDPGKNLSVVVGDRDWHPGVLGIVAAKLMRRHHRPAIVVGFNGDGMGKGSCRSVEGVSLVEVLGKCESLLEQFGGHEMAAGVTLHEDRFDEFRGAFEAAVRSVANVGAMVPRLHLDACIELSEIDDGFLDAQEQLEPFGHTNVQPVFYARAVRPMAEPRVLKEKHLRFDLGFGRIHLPAIFFNGAEDDLPRMPWDVAFRVERNTFQGRDEPQLHVVGIRSAA